MTLQMPVGHSYPLISFPWGKLLYFILFRNDVLCHWCILAYLFSLPVFENSVQYYIYFLFFKTNFTAPHIHSFAGLVSNLEKKFFILYAYSHPHLYISVYNNLLI